MMLPLTLATSRYSDTSTSFLDDMGCVFYRREEGYSYYPLPVDSFTLTESAQISSETSAPPPSPMPYVGVGFFSANAGFLFLNFIKEVASLLRFGPSAAGVTSSAAQLLGAGGAAYLGYNAYDRLHDPEDPEKIKHAQAGAQAARFAYVLQSLAYGLMALQGGNPIAWIAAAGYLGYAILAPFIRRELGKIHSHPHVPQLIQFEIHRLKKRLTELTKKIESATGDAREKLIERKQALITKLELLKGAEFVCLNFSIMFTPEDEEKNLDRTISRTQKELAIGNRALADLNDLESLAKDIETLRNEIEADIRNDSSPSSALDKKREMLVRLESLQLLLEERKKLQQNAQQARTETTASSLPLAPLTNPTQ